MSFTWVGGSLADVFAFLDRLLLDATYRLTGGALDLQLAGLLSWLRTAIFVITFVNLAEAIIRLQTQSLGPSEAANSAGATKRKSSRMNPPSRAMSASPSPSFSSSPAPNSKRSTPRHYAQDSPLRDSILRASVSAQGQPGGRGSSPGIGDGRRLPSETPRFESLRSASTRKPSSNATPLAAYLARKQERIASGQDFGDLSFDGTVGGGAGGDASDLSTDSIEVDRALRALSASYTRELSQSRAPPSPGVVA